MTDLMQFTITGSNSEAVAAGFKAIIEKHLGVIPTQLQSVESQDPHTKSFFTDNFATGVAILTIVLAIPPMIQASMDISDRLKKEQQVKSFLDEAKDYVDKNPGSDILIKTPKGTYIHILSATPDKLIDTVLQSAV